MGRSVRVFLGLSACDLFIGYMRWLLWRSSPEWHVGFWWPFLIYQVQSGYPPGELAHWDDYPFDREKALAKRALWEAERA